MGSVYVENYGLDKTAVAFGAECTHEVFQEACNQYQASEVGGSLVRVSGLGSSLVVSSQEANMYLESHLQAHRVHQMVAEVSQEHLL